MQIPPSHWEHCATSHSVVTWDCQKITMDCLLRGHPTHNLQCLHCETQTYQRRVNSKPVSTFLILPRVTRTETPNKKVFFQILQCLSDMPQFKVYSLENMDVVSNIGAVTETNPGLSHIVTFLVLLVPYHLVLLLCYHLHFPSSSWKEDPFPFGQIPQPSLQMSSLPITHFIHPPVKLPYPCENE